MKKLNLIVFMLFFTLLFSSSAQADFTTQPMVSAGQSHSLALKDDGAIYAWGYNGYGQLGDNTTTFRLTPVRTWGLTAAKHISAGCTHSLAVAPDECTWAWGDNYCGQLGNGTNIDKKVPVRTYPDTLTFTKEVSAGYRHSLVLMTNNKPWSFGYNNSGQLGNGNYKDKNIPYAMLGSGYFKQVSAGYEHSLGVKSDGTVWACGVLYPSTSVRNTFVELSKLNKIEQVSAGYDHSLALDEDGNVWAWGKNNNGQVGDGSTNDCFSPAILTSGLSNIIQISAGACSSLALDEDGTVWAWGGNANGQLGDGTTVDKHSPVKVCGPNGEGFLTDVIQISMGYAHSLALKSDGTVWAWGGNSCGQLGDGTTINKLTPVQVLGSNGVGFLSLGQGSVVITLNDISKFYSNVEGYNTITITGTTVENISITALLESVTDSSFSKTTTTNSDSSGNFTMSFSITEEIPEGEYKITVSAT